jgi:hypothetical protein
MRRTLQWIVLLCVIAYALPYCAGQDENSPAQDVYSKGNTSPVRSKPPVAPMPAMPAQKPLNSTLDGDATDQAGRYPVPQIRVIMPPSTPTPWTLHERIGWGARVGLAIVGYLGVLIALRMLYQTRGQLNTVGVLARAAIEAANAAALHSRVLMDAERPWIRMTIERSREAANTLQIVATNRGRTPAEIVDCPDKISLVKDERMVNRDLWQELGRSDVLKSPILLMPQESTVLQRFGRADAKWVCKTEERLAAVRRCEETIYIFGRVIYRSIHNPEQRNTTDWCFRYVHGESISELVMDGPFGYNRHT